ncbi:MAG: hypothetical protein O9252_03300, partial [Algoriphagus sp.]|nr:hypothetical protein [Algoriphagus sp.]
SLWHNLFSIVFLSITYLGFYKGFGFFWSKSALAGIILTSFLTFHILSVGMMTEDWDGRFLIPILPVVFLIGSVGIGKALVPNN